VFIAVIALSFIWSLPTIGLFGTSFRTSTDINETGWWTAFQPRHGNPDYNRAENRVEESEVRLTNRQNRQTEVGATVVLAEAHLGAQDQAANDQINEIMSWTTMLDDTEDTLDDLRGDSALPDIEGAEDAQQAVGDALTTLYTVVSEARNTPTADRAGELAEAFGGAHNALTEVTLPEIEAVAEAQAILAEAEEMLAQLQESAYLTERLSVLDASLAEAQATTSAQRIDDLATKLDNAQSMLSNINVAEVPQVEEIQAALTEAQAALANADALASQMQEKQTVFEDAKTEFYENRMIIAKSQAALEGAEEAISNRQKEAGTAFNEADLALNPVERLLEDVQTVQADVDDAQAELDQAEAELAGTTEALLTATVDETQAVLNVLVQARGDDAGFSLGNASDIQAQSRAALDTVTVLMDEVETAQADVQEARAQLEQSTAVLAEAEASLEAQESGGKVFESAMKSARSALVRAESALSSTNTDAQEILTDAIAEVNEAEQDEVAERLLTALTETSTTIEAPLSEAQALMAEAHTMMNEAETVEAALAALEKADEALAQVDDVTSHLDDQSDAINRVDLLGDELDELQGKLADEIDTAASKIEEAQTGLTEVRNVLAESHVQDADATLNALLLAEIEGDEITAVQQAQEAYVEAQDTLKNAEAALEQAKAEQAAAEEALADAKALAAAVANVDTMVTDVQALATDAGMDVPAELAEASTQTQTLTEQIDAFVAEKQAALEAANTAVDDAETALAEAQAALPEAREARLAALSAALDASADEAIAVLEEQDDAAEPLQILETAKAQSQARGILLDMEEQLPVIETTARDIVVAFEARQDQTSIETNVLGASLTNAKYEWTLERTDEYIYFGAGEWEDQWTLNNYEEVFSEQYNIDDAFVNSLIITIPSVVIPITVAAFAAYAFAWLEFPGRNLFFAVVVILMVVPLHTALMPILRMYVDIDLNGTYLGIWLAHTGFGMPLAVYLLYGYISTIPREVMESASIDGASPFTAFTRLILPLSVPAIASFTIFQFLWVWNDLLVALVFLGTNDEVRPLTRALSEMVGSKGEAWEVLTAGAFITIILPLFVFFALQRYFVRGMMAGSVKG